MSYGDCGCGSVCTDWRLPNVKELQSLIDYSTYNPSLPDSHPFTNVQSAAYWSSTSVQSSPGSAWKVAMDLAPYEQTDQTSMIDALDKEVAMLGGLIRNPGLIIGIVTKIIRLGERGTVSEIINILR